MSASDLLKRAVEYEVQGRRMEALKLYTDGIEELMKIYQSETNPEKRSKYQSKIVEFLDRAEQIKQFLKQLSAKAEIKERIRIIDGAKGYSYEKVFGKYLDDTVEELTIEDPYLREFHQLCQLVMLCELIVAKCRTIKYIKVITVKDARPNNDQEKAFNILKTTLKTDQNILLDIEYSETIHDREIIISNGHIIKIGRGLDYFKPPSSKFCLGAFNFNFRPCRETNIEISFFPDMKK